LKLAISANLENAEVIQELLSAWEVSWVSPKDSDVVISYGSKLDEQSKKTVLVPSDSTDFENWARRSKYVIAKRSGDLVSVAASPAINLSFIPEVSFEIKPETCGVNQDLFIPQFDVVKECNHILERVLNTGSSVTYRLATSFPLAYNIVPKRLRDYLMKERGKRSRPSFCDVLDLDALRFVLANAIEEVSNEKLRRRTWDHKASVCVLTHDIDTKEGLEKSGKVKRLEGKYDLPSAWFIPSKQYSLNRGIIEELGNNGEVGSHDTRHDGRLSGLSKKKLTERLTEGKRRLESITKCPVQGFRAPLLQHNSNILLSLQECGFKYDTSIPTWEPKHPRTMSPHGVGTVFPIRIEGMNEIPITAVQDHQLLHVLRLTPKEAIAEWFSNMILIKELGGSCVFLSHPEYDLLDTQGLLSYEELLNTIASDSELLVACPSRIISLRDA
jgi:hypothetical protein